MKGKRAHQNSVADEVPAALESMARWLQRFPVAMEILMMSGCLR
jgi:hypothetical protein